MDPEMRTILMVEDNRDDARLMVRLLRRQGYRVLHAGDGHSGLELAIYEQPDLILLDLGLPDLDGQTVATMLRTIPGLAPGALVLVTAWPPDVVREIAEAYGCDGFISKPFSLETFITQVEAFIASLPNGALKGGGR